jgi:hypothetical protein
MKTDAPIFSLIFQIKETLIKAYDQADEIPFSAVKRQSQFGGVSNDN